MWTKEEVLTGFRCKT